MYAHITHMIVPLDKLPLLRDTLRDVYLKEAEAQDGFIRHYFLEQVDDPTRAQLVQVWENQGAMETFRATGAIDDANRRLHDSVPGLRMQSQGYIVRQMVEA